MFANVQDDYNLRIIDFGLAEQLEEGRDDVFMTMCGTLEYMSPEVMDCKHASRASGEELWRKNICTMYLIYFSISLDKISLFSLSYKILVFIRLASSYSAIK